MLDTTAFSAAMRNEAEMVTFLQELRPGEIATVPPVAAEIEYGIRRIDPETKKYSLLIAQKTKLLSVIRILPWDSEASQNFGIIKAALERAGTPLDDFDIAIGAIALSHNAEVITANLTHFSRIHGLVSRHWH